MNYHFLKAFLFPLSFLFLLTTCEDQKEDKENGAFVKTFGGNLMDFGRSVQQTVDGGYIILSSTQSFGNGGADVWLIKTDYNGNEEWNQIFGGSLDDWGLSAKQTTDGGFIVIGVTLSFGNGDFDIWLIKTDSHGQEEWNQTFGESGKDRGYSVQPTMDGGYILTGTTVSFGNGGGDVWLIKTDSQGKEQWSKTFGGEGFDFSSSVQQDVDGGYIIGGYTSSLGNGSYNVWLIKTDAEGEETWNRTFGGSNNDQCRSLQQTTDGGYILTGQTWSFGNEGDVWLIKTDSEGQEEWTQTFDGGGRDNGYSVQQTADGGYIITGYTEMFETGTYDAWLIKTDSQGNEEWNRTFGGSDYEYGYSVQQTTDGGYILTGETNTYGNGDADIWLIKTDSEGNTAPYGD